MEIISEHLEKFKQCSAGSWAGRTLDQYQLQDFGNQIDIKENLDRDRLHSLCANSSLPVDELVMAIMAWGGANARYARLLWSVRKQWPPFIARIRDENLSRAEAYAILYDLQRSRQLPGVGPAYYTKFLFFLRAKKDAYIMDQWTAKSMALLCPERAPTLLRNYGRIEGHRVCPTNNAEAYERFCLGVEVVAKASDLSPEETEKRMFGQGGRTPSDWRAYLKKHYK